ncbi:MAG: SufS family cysteine desulfurase [Rhodoplanes sp.]
MSTASLAVRRASPEVDRDALDSRRLRDDFPIFSQTVNGRPLVYLDSAASAQKPRAVLDAMRDAYERDYANVHRGVHTLSQRATQAFEAARSKVAHFINARRATEIVFVRGATEAINLVASTFGRKMLQAGDEIVISELEHHSNIVPWQLLRDERKIALKVAPIDDAGNLLLDRFADLLSPRTRLVAMTHVSNALGTITPIAEIVRLAHGVGAFVLVDGCQAVPHTRVDVQAIGADFYAFSGHKIYGPTGIGVLYGKERILDEMPPYQGGGEMILSVTFERTTYKKAPHRFEAGTPAIVEAIGLGAAVDYLEKIGLDRIKAHEHALLEYATERLSALPRLRLVGTAARKAAIVSFVVDGVHPHDIGTILDQWGVAIRAGHHCAQPLMHRLGLPATARASFGLYNTVDDVDALADGLEVVLELFH